jgi:putative restriction endonuclease
VKGVFDVKPGSPYKDRVAEWYHFPKRSHYVEAANLVRGDWILYRESKRDGGRKGYVGAAFVTDVEDAEPGFAIAKVERYFEFDPPIPLKDRAGQYREAMLRAAPNPGLVGRTIEGKSLRTISDEDFAAIVSEALGETLSAQNLVRYGPTSEDQSEITAPQDPGPLDAFVRRIEATLVNKKVRATNFRKLVCHAYDETCAVTGLRIINGGGRSEAQAAHIWSVESGGPDSVQNGIALSGTVHWLFDRHLISLSPEYRLLVADNRIPQELRGLFPSPLNSILLPKDKSLWPNPRYVELHREEFAGH